MSVRYELTCSCGRKHPVETSRSGQSILCECGATLKIPTMLKMKRLPVWSDGDETESNGASSPDGAASEPTSNARSQAAESSRPARTAEPAAEPTAESIATRTAESTGNATADASAKSRKPKKLSSKRIGLFIVAACFCVFGSGLCCANIPEPNPIAVFYRQTNFNLGDGRRVTRDSTPIEQGDYDFYFLYDPINKQTYRVDGALIDAMNVYHAYQYFDAVKTLDLSDNFYELYDSLKTKRVIRLCGFGLVALLGLAVALFALFAPESTKQVGTMRGSDWR